MPHARLPRLAASLRLAGTIALAACLGWGGNAAAQAPRKLTEVNYVGFAGGPINLVEHVAIQKGLFAAHGLDVKFVGVTTQQQFSAALMGGSAQFGLMISSSTVPLAAQGQCFQYFNSDARQFYNLIAQPEVALPNAARPFPENLQDLKGKKVGIVGRGGGMEYMLNAVLQEAGLKPADVTYIATGGAATAVAAFRAKQVEVLMTFPPEEQMLKPQEFKPIAKLIDVRERNPIYNLTQGFSGATCAYAKANPQLVDAFCSAIADAYKYVHAPANRGTVVGVLQKVMGIDEPMAAALWDQYKTSWPSPKIERAAWEQQKIILPAGTPLPRYEDVVHAGCQAKY